MTHRVLKICSKLKNAAISYLPTLPFWACVVDTPDEVGLSAAANVADEVVFLTSLVAVRINNGCSNETLRLK